jgi:hypothetical protein
MSDDISTLAEAMAEIRRLRARVLELEAAATVRRGTIAQPSGDGPSTITHGHAPSAPPHNE